MDSPINKDLPRPIEVRFRDVSKDKVTVRSAERYQRSACDFFAVVQGYHEEKGDVLIAASFDGATRGPLTVDQFYNIWLSIAGTIVNSDDESTEAMKIRRFCKMVLERVQLDEHLGRFQEAKAEADARKLVEAPMDETLR